MRLTQQTLRKMIKDAINEVNIGGEQIGSEDFSQIDDVDIVNDAINAAEQGLKQWLSTVTQGMPGDMASKYGMIADKLSDALIAAGPGDGVYDRARAMNEDDEEASDEEYAKERKKMRKRVHGPTGHDYSKKLSDKNPFELNEKKYGKRK